MSKVLKQIRCHYSRKFSIFELFLLKKNLNYFEKGRVMNSFFLRKAFLCGGLTVFCVLACIYLYLYDPSLPGTFYPRCAFFDLTGYKCAACGSLRALHNLLHGNIAAAFGYNPLLLCFMPLLFYIIIHETFKGRCRVPLPGGTLKCLCLMLLSALFYAILRNLF